MVRAFVRLRELAATHGDLAKRLDDLEQKTEALALNHDTFSRNTRNQLKQVFDALRELMTPPDPPKRPIGFVTTDDKGNKGKARSKKLTPDTPSDGLSSGQTYPPQTFDASPILRRTAPSQTKPYPIAGASPLTKRFSSRISSDS